MLSLFKGKTQRSLRRKTSAARVGFDTKAETKGRKNGSASPWRDRVQSRDCCPREISTNHPRTTLKYTMRLNPLQKNFVPPCT